MLEKTEKLLTKIEEYACVLLLVVMSVVVLAQVLFRYIFAIPLSWSEELARYCLIWLTFVAGAMCIRSNAHFVIDILLTKLSRSVRIKAQILILAGMGVFSGVMLYTGIIMLPIVDLQISSALRLSMSYIYLAIPIGSFLMLFHIICAIQRHVHSMKQPSDMENTNNDY